MLDKTLPYKNIVMALPAAAVAAIPAPALPDGFTLRFFREGDETHWARIETSVGEFETESEARGYFVRDFLPYPEELARRCLFLANHDGLPIATATAWFARSALGYQASLHWVAVCPEFQGRGLGKAIVQSALRLSASRDPGCDLWLHTQTWSSRAVRLYLRLGFEMMRHARLAVNTQGPEGTRIYPNDCAEALKILATVLDPETLRRLSETAR